MSTPSRQGDLFDADPPGGEGLFDAQLALPLPGTPAPEPFASVVKRDGRLEPFNWRKIVEGILRATGDQDRELAEGLASAVTIYLGKRLGSAPPTVDQVHDAVERVLIHMGHARAALAYARHRDRRARIRRLREGDLRLLAGELEEAQRGRDALRAHGDRALFVRAHADAAAPWDRARVAESLARETGLERPLADLVALEVEQWIARAGMTRLTTGLIRELVDAKLAERGLDAQRGRHRRLGIPLFDTERIVQGAAPDAEGCDPVATDRALARAVKREYALGEVFSAEVAEAHAAGAIHLHALGAVDRLYHLEHSLDAVTTLGLGLPGVDRFADPPKHADTLLAHWVKSTETIEAVCARPPAWDAVNFGVAPFLHGLSERAVTQVAQMIVYEFAYRALSHGPAAPTEIALAWNVPPWLAGREAVGPGGGPTDRVYDDYEHTAQQLAWAIVDVFHAGQSAGQPFAAPRLRVRLAESTFRAPGGEDFLAHAGQLAAVGRPVDFDLDRAPRAIGDDEEPWQPRHAVLHLVSLNLPRAALRAGTADRLWNALDDLLQIAVRAHAQKRDFIARLIGRDTAGPLATLCRRRDGTPYLEAHLAACLVGVEGLHEALEALTRGPADAPEAIALGVRLLDFLRQRCDSLGPRHDLRLALAQANNPAVGARFADRDRDLWPEAVAALAKPRPDGLSLGYTPGVEFARDGSRSAVEIARVEGCYHPRLAFGARTATVLPGVPLSEHALADFLKKTWRQTGNRRIAFEGAAEA